MANIHVKSLQVIFLIFFSLVVGSILWAQQSLRIRSIDNGFAYQKGPVFLLGKKAFLISSKNSVRIRCPHINIISPFQVELNEAVISLGQNRICFSSDLFCLKVIGKIWQEMEGIYGFFKCFGKNKDRYIKVGFRLSDSTGLLGKITLGKEGLRFYWIDRIQALYIDLDGVDLANLSYFFYRSVEGQGKLKGGLLLFNRNRGGKIIGGVKISKGWVGKPILSLFKMQGVNNIDSRVLPIDGAELKVDGDINELKVWVKVHSILGRFRSQYFAPLKIPAILESSKEVGR